MSSDACIADRLTVLNEHGRSILFNCYYQLNLKKTLIFSKDYDKLNKAVTKVYPKMPLLSKLKEYQKMIKMKKTALNDQVGPWYALYDRLQEFVYLSVQTLKVSAPYVKRVGGSGSVVRDDFFRLVVCVTKMCYVIRNLPDSRLILSYSAILERECELDRGGNDDAIFKFFRLWERPLEKLREQLKDLHQTVGKALLELGKRWDQQDHESKDGKLLKWQSLEVFQMPQNIEKQESDTELSKFIQRDEVGSMILFSYLAMPEAMAAPEDTSLGKKVGKRKTLGTMLLSRVLSKFYMFQVFGNLLIDVQDEFDNLFARYKSPFKIKLGKFKKHLDKMTPQRALLFHSKRKQYLHVQLKNTYHALHDSPYLAGPKFPLIVSLLSLAHGEVKWFVLHRDCLRVWGKKASFSAKVRHVREIMYYADMLVTYCRMYSNIIRDHYKELLATNEKFQFNLDKVGDKLDDDAMSLVEHIAEEIESNDTDLFGARLTWKRVCVHCVSKLKLRDTDVRAFFAQGEEISKMSLHIDSVLQTLTRYSMNFWFYFPRLYEELFRYSLKGDLYFCITQIRLYDWFREVAPPIDYELREKIGFESTIPAEKFLARFIEKILRTLNDFLGGNGYHLLFKRIKVKVKDQVVFLRPGAESAVANAQKIAPLARLDKILCTALGVVNHHKEIQVYDTVFYPLEYLKSGIEEMAERFIERLVNVDALSGRDPEATLTPPSKIVNRVNVLISVLSMMDEYIHINPREVVLSALVNKFIPVGAGRENIVSMLSRFYCSRIVKRVREHHLLFHPIKNTFCNTRLTSKTLPRIVAEHYLDQNELVSLVNLVGPFGIQIIDKRLLLASFAAVDRIKKEMVVRGKDRLKEFEDNLFERDIFRGINDKRADFPSMDRFFDMCVDLGAFLQFRLNVRSALKRSMKTNAPQIYSVVKNVREQCDSRVKKMPIFKQINHLAVDCGIFEGEDSFKEKLTELTGDDWKVLPVIFATLLTSKRFAECMYNTELEGWDNNAHLIILAFKELMRALFDESELNGLCTRFCRCAGQLLLRMRQSKQYEKQTSNCYIFIDKLITATPFLRLSMFEFVNPHILVRNAYFEFFDQQKKRDDRKPKVEKKDESK